MSVGRAVLEAEGDRTIWELDDVATITASEDGSTVALLTGDHQVFVSRLPQAPRPIANGPYAGPELSRDGKRLLVQRLGHGAHILDKIASARGIALIDLVTGQERLLLEGNDVYAPSFASDQLVFFGSGGPDSYASVYLLDLATGKAARVTNREPGARQKFPSETPRLAGTRVTYRSDGEELTAERPAANDFRSVNRFDLGVAQ
jgi:hypothetical protein